MSSSDQSSFPTHHFLTCFSQPFLILIYIVSFAYASGTITIESLVAYSVQRACVQDCIWGGTPGGGPNIPEYLSCPQPFSDNCLCRTDLSASAINYLTSCVNSVCSGNTVDLSNAVSLYTGYCNSDLSMIAFAAPVTIENSGEYSSLRGCAQQCLWGGTDGGGLPLPQVIGCSNNLNLCMCRSDLSPSASAFLTTCVDSNCSGDINDLSSAIAAYTIYCGAALATTTSESAAASTNSASPSQSSAIAMSTSAITSPVITRTSSTTVATPTNTSGTTSALWTPGKIAGVTVGSIAGIFIIIFTIVFRCRPKPRPIPIPPRPEPDRVSYVQGSTSKVEPKVTQIKVDDSAKELSSQNKSEPKAHEIGGSEIQQADGVVVPEVHGLERREVGGNPLWEMDAYIPEIDSKQV